MSKGKHNNPAVANKINSGYSYAQVQEFINCIGSEDNGRKEIESKEKRVREALGILEHSDIEAPKRRAEEMQEVNNTESSARNALIGEETTALKTIGVALGETKVRKIIVGNEQSARKVVGENAAENAAEVLAREKIVDNACQTVANHSKNHDRLDGQRTARNAALKWVGLGTYVTDEQGALKNKRDLAVALLEDLAPGKFAAAEQVNSRYLRAMGRELGIDEELIKRHPFPGPGLAIRIPGEITPEKIQILQEADAIYISAIREAGLYDEIWQAFAVLLPVKTVGVMGDARTYEYVCALRAVTSTDGMTADFYNFSHEFLGKVSTKIINNVKGINRIVYDITSKPPGTIEWE